MLANVTAEPAHWKSLQPQLAEFLAALPAAAPQSAPVDGRRPADVRRPRHSRQGQLRRQGRRPLCAWRQAGGDKLVTRRYLRTTWLWDKIRVQGGAYGGQCNFDRYSGGFTFVSYRDPNLLGTLDTYDRTADFLRGTELDEAELTRHIIGTIGEIDTYRLPDAKGFASMQRHLIGDTDEARQRMRDEILSTTAADIRDFAEADAQSGRQRAGCRPRFRTGDRGCQRRAAGIPDRVQGDVSVLQLIQEFLQSTAVEGERLRNRSSGIFPHPAPIGHRSRRRCQQWSSRADLIGLT